MIQIKYFAVFREQAEKQQEKLDFKPMTLGELYEKTRETYKFTLNLNQVQFVVNEEYRDVDYVIEEGDEVVFIPPVAGG